jgi:hypothetical protein
MRALFVQKGDGKRMTKFQKIERINHLIIMLLLALEILFLSLVSIYATKVLGTICFIVYALLFIDVLAMMCIYEHKIKKMINTATELEEMLDRVVKIKED